MKTITIAQPFAELIARGEKLIENRTWPTNYRGPLAIHVGQSKAWLDKCPDVPREEAEQFTRGAIVAVVELVDCVRLEDLQAELFGEPWSNHPHAFGPWCWLLRNAVRLPEPIPCKGQQSLWDAPLELGALLSGLAC